ncbi:MAG: hypothetical protein KG012_10430 [Deltaproteobacteria bacterium]|nr:hypothetical protein [Deltaproteobacteria bacterium]
MSKSFLVIILFIAVFASVSLASAPPPDSSSSEVVKTSKSEKFEAWWLGPLVQLIAIVAGAYLIKWQVRENAREKLKLRVYEAIKTHIESVSEPITHAGSYSLNIPGLFKDHQAMLEPGMNPSPIKGRASVLLEHHAKVQDAIVNLFKTLESYDIITPNLGIFRIALSSASHDLSNAFTLLFSESSRFLPVDVPEDRAKEVGTKIIERPMPTQVQLETIEHLADQYYKATVDVGSYLDDLSVKAQNILLGKLFGHRLPPRQPSDPKIKVITADADRVQELKKYFQEETEWGRKESEIRQRLKENR